MSEPKRIYIHRPKHSFYCARTEQLIKDGLANNSEICITNDHALADLIIFPFFSLIPKSSEARLSALWENVQLKELANFPRNKVVVIDCGDNPESAVDAKIAKLIFKRSLYLSLGAIRRTTSYLDNPNVYPFTIGGLDDYPKIDSPKDLTLFAPIRPTDSRRSYILDLLNGAKLENSHIGEISNGQLMARHNDNNIPYFCPKYFNQLARSRIVVLCQPAQNIGVHSLFEALHAKCCVLIDKQYQYFDDKTLFPPFCPGYHLFEYSCGAELLNIIDLLIHNPNLVEDTANAGHYFYKENYTPRAIMKRVYGVIFDKFGYANN